MAEKKHATKECANDTVKDLFTDDR